MLRKFDYSWLLLKRSLWLILPIAGIGMAESKLVQQRCTNLVISIQGDSGTRFLNQMDVRMLLTENGGDPLVGSRLKDVALNDLENRVSRNKLIRKCQVFRDLRGNIVVEVEQEKPLARWINTSENGEMRNTSGYYINHEGVFFPLSDSYSARTLLVSGSYFTDPGKLRSEKGAQVLELLRFLNTDPFWKAQVTHLNADKDGEIYLTTLVGDQRIELGRAEDFQSKFRKLRIFYNKVLSNDWGRYKRISVKFQDQIVCE
ncbi:cell division protein FtsQ/DivIB [Dyadobacter sp. MSC1_007]|jgi:cell division protein FtsQ|uniref:cell division protein FtsQ/DivIB n=1 Tax=Dyadobacter sp. MSC1_007 TaxID=2909264 RepID=UPI00202FB2EB|nr:cell division protein FtsQ/DivIB [Dyadobacter sp. MSC1_007]